MSHYWPEFLAFATVHIFSLISPGPDFMVVVRNSTTYSRKTAILTALGIATGEITHIIYAIFGIGVVLARYPMGLTALKYAGAAYLVYIGVQSLRARKMLLSEDEAGLPQVEDLPPWQAYRSGLITNALNIKASFFTISCFAVLVSPETPLLIQGFYSLFIISTTTLWFTLVATCLTHRRVQRSLFGVKHWIERTAGAVLVLLGIKLSMTDMGKIIPPGLID